MATAYGTEGWTDLFVASAGASAALTGLLFVAVSINLQRILELKGVPERALQALMFLLATVVVSLIGLLPGQGATALGAELLGIALLFGAAAWGLALRTIEPGHRAWWVLERLALTAVATVPLVVGGASILARSGGGLYWIAAGVMGSIVAASIAGWVLLVEIMR